MAANLSPQQQALVDYVQKSAPLYGLDAAAVLAVSQAEGFGGGIGDSGTSFGPWQLHIGGALPAAIGAQGSAAANAWAWSQEGVNYALQQMAGVAKGLTGGDAVKAIVTNFERPANPLAEISAASINLLNWVNSRLGSGDVIVPALSQSGGGQTGGLGAGLVSAGNQIGQILQTVTDPCSGLGGFDLIGCRLQHIADPIQPTLDKAQAIGTWVTTGSNWWKVGLTLVGVALIGAGLTMFIVPIKEVAPLAAAA